MNDGQAQTVTSEIIARIDGAAGRITLNRPKALNALNFAMVRAMTVALAEWRDDPRVRHVVIDGAGERAFCAGGDIRAVYDAIAADPELARDFWRAEYRLNAMIAIMSLQLPVSSRVRTIGRSASIARRSPNAAIARRRT